MIITMKTTENKTKQTKNYFFLIRNPYNQPTNISLSLSLSLTHTDTQTHLPTPTRFHRLRLAHHKPTQAHGGSQQVKYHWRELPQVFLSPQNTSFVATKVCSPRQNLCHDKTVFLSRQKIFLIRQNFCIL